MKSRLFIQTAVVTVTAVILFCSCSPSGIAGLTSAGVKTLQAATLSDAYVESMVHQYIVQLDQSSDVAGPNDPYTLRLERIVAPIDDSGFNFKVYRTGEVNAFAVADGSIRVYTGLMDIMSDAEILGVIGHEIGHVMNKDSKDAFRHALLTSAIRDGLSATGGVVGALSASELGDLTESLSSSQYSQKQELEADDYGYRFLVSHGVNPWVLAMSFEKLEEVSRGSRSSSVQQLFSSHPDTANRINRIAQRATQDGYRSPENGGSLLIGSGSKTGKNPSAGYVKTSSEWSF